MLRPQRNAGFACYLKVEAGEWQKLCIVPAVLHNRPVPCNSRFGQLHHNWRQPCRFRFKIRNWLSPVTAAVETAGTVLEPSRPSRRPAVPQLQRGNSKGVIRPKAALGEAARHGRSWGDRDHLPLRCSRKRDRGATDENEDEHGRILIGERLARPYDGGGGRREGWCG